MTFVLAVGLVAGGCRRRNEAKERIQAEREAWEASLPDSLKAVERQTDSLRNEIKQFTADMGAMLPSFEYVNNPREVEGYYIAKGWVASYPLKATGLVARLTKGENLELIAALSGGAHFNQIRINVGGETAETSVVPYDQALNYRFTNLNIVCFSDSASNSCAELIARNNGSDVKITFLNSGKQTGTFSYPQKSQKLMIETWNLYDTRSSIQKDERLIPLLAKKGAIISGKIEKLKEKSN